MRLNQLRVDDPAYVFTPKNARWRHELAVFTRLWPLKENKFLPGKSFETKRFVNVLITARYSNIFETNHKVVILRDGGDVLRPALIAEIKQLNEYIMNNISVETTDHRYNLTYQDLCLNYDWVCGANEHIEMFEQRVKIGKYIDLAYPKGGMQDTPVYRLSC
jgi:hypothetical protein